MQRIIYVPFLVLAIVCLAILITVKIRAPHCGPLDFAVPISALVDEKVSMVDSTAGVTSRLWDFGDSTERSTDRFPTHRYAHPGKYIVSLTVNGSCRDVQEIVIKPQPVIQGLAQISGPTGQVYIGDKVPFSEKTEGATSWDWTFGENGKVDAHDRQVTYTYMSPGYKTVTVYVNTPNGKLSGTFTVNVKSKDAGVKTQLITPADVPKGPTGAAKKNLFEAKLTSFLTKNDMSSRTKLYTDMEQLVCNGNIPVLWITPKFRKDKKTSFDEFCRGVISDKDVYIITSIDMKYDDAKDCVNGITVKMKAK